MKRLETISPVRVLLIVLAVVFVVEATIMVVVQLFEVPPGDGILLSFIDALVLIIALCPALWLLVVRPLRATMAVRGQLLARVLTAQEEERARLARDLHDELGQMQTAVLLGARSITAAATLADARARAEEVARMAGSALDASRRLARGIGPGVLIDLGLGVAAERLCEDLSAGSGVAIEATNRIGQRRFDAAIEIAAYRVLQEAITNALRHSGAAMIRVSVEADERSLRLQVGDDGRGMSSIDSKACRGGMGLVGMRERLAMLNGAFEIQSAPGAGTTVRAILPLARSGEAP